MRLLKIGLGILAIVAIGMSLPSVKGPVQADAQPSSTVLGITGTVSQYQELQSRRMHLGLMGFWKTWEVRTPQLALSEAQTIGAIPLITWQPESPAHLGTITVQSINEGKQDAYISTWASNLKAYGGLVYLRFAHEMNGIWYPWSSDGPGPYIEMWRRVWNIFNSVGASNVRFVWSPDPYIGHGNKEWDTEIKKWWPGRKFVNDIGMSTVYFKQSAPYLRTYFPRIDYMHQRYKMPVVLPEMKAYYQGRYTWLKTLQASLPSRPWIKAIAWSETKSTAQALGQFGTGQMNWSLSEDPTARHLLVAAISSRRR